MKLKTKLLTIKQDSRGRVFEVLRPEDVGHQRFGQILISTAQPGQIKGNHYHLRKREWYCVIKGRGLLILIKRGSNEKKELEIGERNMQLVEIPRGVLHAIKNIGSEEMFLMTYTDEPFSPADPDTYHETAEDKI